jgi:hypothetical protein
MFQLGCVKENLNKNINISNNSNYFTNKGFALIYSENLYNKKIIKSKIENRSLLIFQKNLKKDTNVKITNLINSKSLIAKVASSNDYPVFFNSVISVRISKELELNILEPYIEIKELIDTNSFIAKKAKTFEEEKKVATKAPIDEVVIDVISSVSTKSITETKSKFYYIIKIADFYFNQSAIQMKSRILNETSIKKVSIDKLSNTKFRVFLGPYDDLNSLKNSFNAISILQFENIEIIRK